MKKFIFIFLVIFSSCNSTTQEYSDSYDSYYMNPADSTEIFWSNDSTLITNLDTILFDNESTRIKKEQKSHEMDTFIKKGSDTIIKKDTILKKKNEERAIKLDTISVLQDIKKNRLIISEQQKSLDSLLLKKK